MVSCYFFFLCDWNILQRYCDPLEILSAAYIKYLSTRKRQAELSPLSEVIVKAAIAGGGDDGDEKKESKVVLQCYLDKKDTIMSLARSVKVCFLSFYVSLSSNEICFFSGQQC